MRKLITFFSAILILFALEASASTTTKVLSDEECERIIKTYKIDPKIKSKRGWQNIFRSEAWKKKFLLNGYTQAELDCISEYVLANALKVSKYHNYVGMEMKI